MQYTSRTDHTIYEERNTKSGPSLVVVKSDVEGLKEIYEDITASLNHWFQPFHLGFSDGVVILYNGNHFFLKEIYYHSEERMYTLSCFGTDIVFNVPLGRDIRFSLPLEDVEYKSANSTSFFSSTNYEVLGMPVKLIDNLGTHVIQCGVIDETANLYALSDKYIEMVQDERHVVLSPFSRDFNTLIKALPAKWNTRLSLDKQLVLLLCESDTFIIHGFTDTKTIISSIENPDFHFYLEDII